MLFDAPHRHAHVLGFEHHGGAARIDGLVDGLDDLGCQVFLGLQPLGEHVGDARQLGEAHNAIMGQIGDMGLAHERHHVVLAMGMERDIAHQNDVVIAADLGKGRFQHSLGVFFVAREKFAIGVGDAARRIDQPFAVGVISRPGDQRTHSGLGLFARWAFDHPVERGLGSLGLDVHVHKGCPLENRRARSCPLYADGLGLDQLDLQPATTLLI